MQIKKTKTRWKTFYKFGLRSLKRIMLTIQWDWLFTCDFHRSINSVFVILASSDFSNEGYGYPNFAIFDRSHRLQYIFSILSENGYCQHVENLKALICLILEIFNKLLLVASRIIWKV